MKSPLRLLMLSCSLLIIPVLGWAVDGANELKGKEFPLWPDGAPDDNGLTGPEQGTANISNISKPTYTVYLPEKDKATGAAVVVIPGGGYRVVCRQSEGENIAKMLLPRGIAAIVLKYRLPNGHHAVPANDARRAIRTTRFHAKDWNIDPNKVGVWGFSAGGHLASTVSTVFDKGDSSADDPIEKQSSRPDFSILFYPVISMDEQVTHMGSRKNLIQDQPSIEMVKRYSNETQISKNTPPTFMLHATDDHVVKVANALGYYTNLVKNKVPATLLIFEKGGHGPGAFTKNPAWLPAFEQWLKARGAM